MRKPPTSYHIMNTKANNDTNGVNNGLLYVIRFFEGGIGQNVYSMGTIHRRNCTHRRLEITSTMPRCFLVKSTMSRDIEKSDKRKINHPFHMKRKKKCSLKREKKIAHFIWAKKVSFPSPPEIAHIDLSSYDRTFYKKHRPRAIPGAILTLALRLPRLTPSHDMHAHIPTVFWR